MSNEPKSQIIKLFLNEKYTHMIELMSHQFDNKDLLNFTWNNIKSTNPMCSYKKLIKELDMLITEFLIISELQRHPRIKKQELSRLNNKFRILKQDYRKKWSIVGTIEIIHKYLIHIDSKKSNNNWNDALIFECIFDINLKAFSIKVYKHLYPDDKKFKLLYE